MNNIYIIILLLVIIVVIFLLNKNDNFYSLTEDITAKNIKASGSIDASGNMTATNMTTTQGVFVGNGLHVTGNVNTSGVVTAKKFVSADGTSDLPLSREAIQNIASIYNKDNLSATNINASGNMTATNMTTTQGVFAGNGLHVTGNVDATGNISIWDGKKGFKATLDDMSILGGPNNMQTRIALGRIDNTLYGGTWEPQDLTITAKNLKASGNITANGVINANGGFKTPLDMTTVDGGQVGLWAGNDGHSVRCPNGYYVAGFDQPTHSDKAFRSICRKLPGY
jgi:hypothetical protein